MLRTLRSASSAALRCLAGSLLFAILGSAPPAHAAEPVPVTPLHAGATFEHLQVGKVTYEKVVVRSVNARSLMISHAGGLASIHLRDLSPELQAAFGYNPAAEAAADQALSDAQARAERQRALESESRPVGSHHPGGNVVFDRLLQSFGQPPEIQTSGIDLRPQFSELALNVKNQGPRPSCAVFAVVSALEYQNAQLTGKAERFSEEYLVWATNKTLHRAPRPSPAPSSTDADNSENLDSADAGFALAEVVAALHAYGIPPSASMPYTFTNPSMTVDPPTAVIDEARNHRRVNVIALPGADPAARMANLIQALNADVPVAIGLRWPSWRTLRTGYLSLQHPLDGKGHAVTLVGYENKSGVIEDTVFIFKNSWGVKWGAGGYGYATYHYLALNLVDAILLQVEPLAVLPSSSK